MTKQLERNGLDKGKLTISDKALEKDHPQLYQRGRRPESGAADRGDLPEGGQGIPGER